MENRYYNILKADDHTLVVVILSLSLTNEYLHSLKNDIERMDGNDTVYCDFLLRNGMNNRYFMFDYRTINMISCSAPDYVKEVSNSFFCEQIELFERSLLPIKQREMYISYVCSRKYKTHFALAST